MKKLTAHDIDYERYTWDELDSAAFDIAKDILNKGLEFDRLVALSKGGLAFARSLVDYLQIPDLSTIKIEFYSGIDQTNKAPVITQSLPVSVKKERILLYDDIADSGETLILAKSYLQQHGVESIHSAVLITKPKTKFVPDFSSLKSEAWVIFPNETRESIELLQNNWLKAGDDLPNIKQRLLELGFRQEELALFLSPE